MGGNTPRLGSGWDEGIKAIITSYQFHCCGNATAWQTYVEPGGGDFDGEYDITFQVWRPSPTVNSDGCYGLVGENVFTRISSPYLNNGLISVTPEPTNRITARPGDVVGFYAVSRKGGIQLDTSFTGESVWYHRNTDNDPLVSRGEASVCPFPVGSQADRVLRSSTNAAPMLSVDICKCIVDVLLHYNYYHSIATFSCPPSPMPFSSSSPPLMQRTSSLPHPSPTPTPTSTSTPVQISTSQPITTPVSLNTSKSTSQPFITLPETDETTITMPFNTNSGLSQEAIGGIAGVGGVILLFILIVVLIVSIIIFKRKFKQMSTPTVDEGGEMFNMKMQKNESYISTPYIPVTTNEAYATTVPLSPTQEYDSIDIRNYATIDKEKNVQNIEIDVSVATPHIPVTTNESYATTIALTPNQAYGSTNTKKQPTAIDETEDSYDYI